MAVTILYTNYNYSIYESLLDVYKEIITKDVKDKIFTYIRWQDRQAFLLGKLLIWKGLKRLNYDDNCLTKLQFNKFGKPFIDSDVFFNLSHSGDVVVCAFFNKELGIDIEQIQDINIDDFKNIFSKSEFNFLNNSLNQLVDFFRCWTIKESVLKAEGKGLSIPLQLINISEEGDVQYNNKIWYIKEVNLLKNYCCSVATSERETSLFMERLNLELKHLI